MEELKTFTDMKDELLIHNIDKNEQFVFKISKTKMKMAAEMSSGGEHFLSEEFCFFDGNHKSPQFRHFNFYVSSIAVESSGTCYYAGQTRKS